MEVPAFGAVYRDRMVRRRIGRLVVVLVSAALLAGAACSGDDKSPSASGDSTSSTTTASSTSSSSTSSASTTPADTKLTTSGFGRLALGMAQAKAQSDGLIENVRPGCQLGGPGLTTADVTGHPGASVGFTDGKLTDISLSQGATDEGVGIGATIDQAKRTYSSGGFTAEIDDSTVEQFEFITVTILKNGAAAYSFAADPTTKKIELLAVPWLSFCE